MKLGSLASLGLVLTLGLAGCSPAPVRLVPIAIEAATAAYGDEEAEPMELEFAQVNSSSAPTGEYDADLATVAKIIGVPVDQLSFEVLGLYIFETEPVSWIGNGTRMNVFTKDYEKLGEFFLYDD